MLLCYSRRISAFIVLYKLDSDPVSPDLELIYRGGAEGVGSREHYVLALFL